MLLPRSLLVVLNIVALLPALRTNVAGHINPFFLCKHQTAESYAIALNQRDEIVLNNCTPSLANHIMGLISHSSLRKRPVRLNLDPTSDITGLHLETTTHLDVHNNDLAEIDLRNFTRLRHLNLTSNKFRSTATIRLASNHTLISLDLSRNRLLQLDGQTIPTTSRLYISRNNIFQLTNLTLPDSLLELDLTRNEIEDLTLVRFSSPTLKLLNLSINLINAISPATFANLSSLQILVLECNKILDIQLGTFHNNSKLVELNLRDNNLSILKKAVFDHLANLQILDVSKNRLLSLTPDTMQNLNNLVHFSLSENTKLCNSECKHDLEFLLVLGGRLKVLKMNRLRLRRFPVTLTTSIRHLDLSHNQLTSVQMGDLENFPFLEILLLNYNQLRAADKDVFSRMEYLQELYLDANQLQRVPAALPATLKILHLQDNRIAAIRKNDFHRLGNLKVLRLNSNSICYIEAEAFSFLTTLKVLDISHNPILHLSTDALEGANKLETLHASYLQHVDMNVTDLRYFPISEMANLQTLNLSHSPELVKSFLTDFPLLTTVKQLELLDLDDAKLTHVPFHLEHFLPRLRLLSLLGNPVNCTEHFDEWKEPFSLDSISELQLEVGNPSSEVKVRVTRDVLPPPLTGRVLVQSRCPAAEISYSNISVTQFWKRVQLPSRPLEFATTITSPTISVANNLTKSKTTAVVHFTTAKMIAESTTSTMAGLREPAKRKKLNSRSLKEEKATLAGSSDLRAVGNITPSADRLALSLMPEASSFNETIRYEIEQALSTGLSNEEVRSKIDEIMSAFVRPSEVNSTSTAARTKLPPRQSTTLSESSSNEKHQALVWNRSDERISFFDWFPASNQSTADVAGRVAAVDENAVQYTHPGLAIFLIITCFLLFMFASLVAPSCIQNYRWKRHRYRTSEFDNECQRSIEISSISAFVETDMSV